MSKSTYYIVQPANGIFVRYPKHSFHPHITFDAEEATRFTLPEAQRVYKICCANAARGGGDTPRRFPRIIKVTVETKTIKDRR